MVSLLYVTVLLVLVVLSVLDVDVVLGFQPQQIIVTPLQPTSAVLRRAAGTSCLLPLWCPQQAYSCAARARGVPRRTNMIMVFDFLRKRSEEGLAQVQNIATKTIQGDNACCTALRSECMNVFDDQLLTMAVGKFSEALSDSAAYIKTRQAIDAESLQRLTGGLARSRERLLLGISGAFTDDSLDLKAKLEMIEGVLLQADIGGSTTSAIIADLQEYARTERLQEEDIIPVLRERLIEALTLKKDSSSSRYLPIVDSSPPLLYAAMVYPLSFTTLHSMQFHPIMVQRLCVSVVDCDSPPIHPNPLYCSSSERMGWARPRPSGR